MADDEQREDGAEQDPAAGGETDAPEAERHAVPSEEAAEIAAVAEDAPLEALQEAHDAGTEKHEPLPDVAPGGEGHAVPSDEAMEIAGVAEDAPLEAAQEAADRAAESQPAASAAEQQAADGAAEQPPADGAAEQPPAEGTAEQHPADEREARAPAKPVVPGAHLEVDIVPEGVDPLGRGGEEYVDVYATEEDQEPAAEEREEDLQEAIVEPISTAAIDLASGARYRATGKRKTAIARVTLRPGTGAYLVNGRPLEAHFPRLTLQRNIRQPLETVGYEERMDVVARLHGGGISAQAGALRHGVSRALLEADPNLRGELKRRGFLTRDSRAKERKKAGLKKARKRPQFSKR
jgi:small subunit ribosomal protein S9